MKLKPYPKYEESGIQWIGEIPEGWKFHKLKFMLSSLESGSRENDESAPIDKGAFSIGGEHVNWDGTLKLDNERFVSFEYYSSMNRGKIQENDVLLVKDGATIGKTALVIKKPFDKMAVNEHVYILRPNKKISAKLLYYLIDSDSGFRQIKLTETGSAQGGINTEFANKTLFSITENHKEQEIITDFLDSKTSDITKTIEADKRLIELLKEKRIALINHVVTKGLNPKAKMKDSGVEWIGEVPGRWEVKKIKFSTTELRIKSTEADGNGQFIGLENIESMSGKIINYDSTENMEGDALKFKKNTVLFCKLRPYLAKVIVADIDGYCTSELIIYECDKHTDPTFLKYRLLSKGYLDFVNSLTEGVKMPRADPIQLSNVKLPFPPKQEQIQISEYLDKSTSKIDQAIKKIEEKIELLEEYKSSLIHHVVTGKVDVREAVA